MCGQLVCNDILSHKSFRRSVAEMSAIIPDYIMRGSEARENNLFQELDNSLVVIRFVKN